MNRRAASIRNTATSSRGITYPSDHRWRISAGSRHPGPTKGMLRRRAGPPALSRRGDELRASAGPRVVHSPQGDHQAGDEVKVELVRDRMKQRLHRECKEADVQPLGQVGEIPQRRVAGGALSDDMDTPDRANEQQDEEEEPGQTELDGD